MKLSPLNRRRFERFKANKRGWWSLWLFLALFVLSLGAELIANHKPLIVSYDGQWYSPVFKRYPETTFGGEFPLEANYKSLMCASSLKRKAAGCSGRRFPSITPASTTIWTSRPPPRPPSRTG